MQCRTFLVNAFTRDRTAGNPAGVVLDADELSDEQLRAICNTLEAPDTAFVCRPQGPDHDARLRFLTPRREATFIGHATLAAQYVRARIEGKTAARQRLLTGIGIVDTEVLGASTPDADYSIAITQSAPALGPLFPQRHRAAVLAALGLSPGDLHPAYPLQRVAEKAPRLLIGVKSVEVLPRLEPDFEALKRLSPEVGAEGYFVFALERGAQSVNTHARLFCPIMGIPEDPVSGNTHAMLGAYLVHHGLLAPIDGMARFRAHQGLWIGRLGIIDVEVACKERVARSVRIAGDAVIVREGRWP